MGSGYVSPYVTLQPAGPVGKRRRLEESQVNLLAEAETAERLIAVAQGTPPTCAGLVRNRNNQQAIHCEMAARGGEEGSGVGDVLEHVPQGGAAKPPWTPAFSFAIRMSSRKRSQLSLESWTAMILQPPPDGSAAWSDRILTPSRREDTECGSALSRTT